DHETVEIREDPLKLQPHGCAESSLAVQDTIVRGHVTLAAGTLSTLRSTRGKSRWATPREARRSDRPLSRAARERNWPSRLPQSAAPTPARPSADQSGPRRRAAMTPAA